MTHPSARADLKSQSSAKLHVRLPSALRCSFQPACRVAGLSMSEVRHG